MLSLVGFIQVIILAPFFGVPPLATGFPVWFSAAKLWASIGVRRFFERLSETLWGKACSDNVAGGRGRRGRGRADYRNMRFLRKLPDKGAIFGLTL